MKRTEYYKFYKHEIEKLLDRASDKEIRLIYVFARALIINEPTSTKK